MTEKEDTMSTAERFRLKEEKSYWNGEKPNHIMSISGLVPDNWYKDDNGRPAWEKEKKRQNAIIRKNKLKARKSNGNESRKVADQHFPLFYKVLDDPAFRNGLMKKDRFRTYVWLGRHIVRAKMSNDPLRLYKSYYQKGELAACVTTRVLAKSLSIGKSTAADHIKALAREGLIKCRIIGEDKSWDGQRYVVCVFGKHREGKEHWFIQDVFGVSEK